MGDQDKSWAPHICCNSCGTALEQWLNGKKASMPFAVPMIWREPTDHVSNCYFCMVPPIVKGLMMSFFLCCVERKRLPGQHLYQ
ncbi:unnamed protein product [Staurois parvus]|uniref:Uncharacterized protein n=1 Tax=Staurois parvus TaxID=386267 RepID=A0ABN9HPT2_9NEOB|nr:unnamed protein product [Staurois parvus]